MNKKEEQYFWDRNIKPNNKWFWLTKLKWRLRIFGHRTKKIYTLNTGFNINSGLLHKVLWIMIGLMLLQMVIGIINDSVYLIYPNYGNNTQIIRDFLTDLGAS